MATRAADSLVLQDVERLFASRGPLALAEAAARARFLALARPVFAPRGSPVVAACTAAAVALGLLAAGVGCGCGAGATLFATALTSCC